MEANQVAQDLEDRGIKRIKVGGFDVDGVLRGKYISASKFQSALEKGLGFCDVIFGWDSSDVLYDNVEFTGWHTGYPDTLAKIELDSYRVVPWEDATAFFLLDFYDKAGKPLAISPLQVLKRVVKRVEDMGYCPLMSAEYEYFFFNETAASARKKNWVDLEPLSPGMFGYSVLRASTYSDLVTTIIESMNAYDVPIEGMHTETGPGVYETAIAYDHAIKSAVRAALFKTGVKEIAARRGILATFMAKVNKNLPGCGGHIHQSLWNAARTENLFAKGADGLGMSKLFRHYVAGLVRMLPEFTLLYCPTINSYKRLVENTWAPTKATWGLENRTTATRVITGPGSKATRIEMRLAGADTNPFLAFAACLAAGAHGIEKGLKLPDLCKGNAYEDKAGKYENLPRSLAEATDRFEQNGVARDWFGDAFVDHYVATRRWEVRQYQAAVTSWELDRYLELV
ncbi:MAG: glutamine synthetase family protein [bacterium]